MKIKGDSKGTTVLELTIARALLDELTRNIRAAVS